MNTLFTAATAEQGAPTPAPSTIVKSLNSLNFNLLKTVVGSNVATL